MRTLLTLLIMVLLLGAGALIVRADSMAVTLTQDQVNSLGAGYWADGYTKAACDNALTADGATQDQIAQFHLSFDFNHPWPPPGITGQHGPAANTVPVTLAQRLVLWLQRLGL